jgi:sulfonate transport system ATP-binding protein
MTAMGECAALLRARSLRRSFGAREVLTGLDVAVHDGEFVCLVGRSGAGKTVLLRILAGLDQDCEGTVESSAPIGVVFQDARLLPWLTVNANVRLGLRVTDPTDIEAALAEVGMADRLDALPRELSAGEAQRVALARTLIRKPGVLLLDEPFSALDAFTRTEMQDLLKNVIGRRRAAALLVTHDLDEALVLGDRVLVLDQGQIAHDVAVPVEFTDPDMTDLRGELLHRLHAVPGGALSPARRRVPTRALAARRRALRRELPTNGQSRESR